MEQATVPSETSIRRPKRGRVLEQEEGAEPSKSTGSPDDLFNDDDDFVPKTKRKRGAAARAAGWSDDQPLIGSLFTNIQKLDIVALGNKFASAFATHFGSVSGSFRK